MITIRTKEQLRELLNEYKDELSTCNNSYIQVITINSNVGLEAKVDKDGNVKIDTAIHPSIYTKHKATKLVTYINSRLGDYMKCSSMS